MAPLHMSKREQDVKECLYYDSREGTAHCRLCPQMCVIPEGEAGQCRIRRNSGGKLIAEMYGRVCSLNLDPMEKKPLYHYKPGSLIISVGTLGCNLKCGFCQNWHISQSDAPTKYVSVDDLMFAAESAAANVGISYTYNEPLVWYEYVLDAARAAKARGMVNVLVTNGQINEEPLAELLPSIDAMNIDLKSMEDSFYREICGGRLRPTLRTIEIAKAAGVHVEITNLIVPTRNDDPAIIRKLVDWVAALDVRTPLHFSRYFPNYRFDLEPTPANTLKRAYDLAREVLPYVFLGNIQIGGTNDSYCPACGSTLIHRAGYAVDTAGLVGDRCAGCGAETGIIR
jgi:pyruvate formate lyase activating enzyme